MSHISNESQRFNFGLVLVVIAILSIAMGLGFLLTPPANASDPAGLRPPASNTIQRQRLDTGLERIYDRETRVVCYSSPRGMSCVKL